MADMNIKYVALAEGPARIVPPSLPTRGSSNAQSTKSACALVYHRVPRSRGRWVRTRMEAWLAVVSCRRPEVDIDSRFYRQMVTHRCLAAGFPSAFQTVTTGPGDGRALQENALAPRFAGSAGRPGIPFKVLRTKDARWSRFGGKEGRQAQTCR